jgi:hypothetical protein
MWHISLVHILYIDEQKAHVEVGTMLVMHLHLRTMRRHIIKHGQLRFHF